MFQSATLRLTFWYVGILAVISVSFSAMLYQVLKIELQRDDRRQTLYLQNVPFPGGRAQLSEALRFRQENLEETRQLLWWRLIYANAAIVLGGAGLCYWLAKETLGPIKRAHDAQRQFAADASHEFRTPLAVMKAEFSVLLRDRKSSAVELRQGLRSGLEEVARLEDLSSALLSLATTEQGGLLRVPVALDEVVRGALRSIQERKPNQPIHQTVHPVEVLGDAALLRQVVMIILENSLTYAGEKADITLTLTREQRQAVLNIADTGVGMDEHDVLRVTQRFYRVDSSRSKLNRQGFGLGLAIADQIVSAHKGRMRVTSKKNHGTMVTINIPIK
jgi:two-component system, OmpR family, sensor histidine kinase CiaH